MKITDFYYGNKTPSDRGFRDYSDYARTGVQTMQLTAELRSHLSENDCKLLEQLLDLQGHRKKYGNGAVHARFPRRRKSRDRHIARQKRNPAITDCNKSAVRN